MEQKCSISFPGGYKFTELMEVYDKSAFFLSDASPNDRSRTGLPNL